MVAGGAATAGTGRAALRRQEPGDLARQGSQFLPGLHDEGRAGCPRVGAVARPEGGAEVDVAGAVVGGGNGQVVLQRFPPLLALPAPPVAHQMVEEGVQVAALGDYDVGGGAEPLGGQLDLERQDVVVLVGIRRISKDELWVRAGRYEVQALGGMKCRCWPSPSSVGCMVGCYPVVGTAARQLRLPIVLVQP